MNATSWKTKNRGKLIYHGNIRIPAINFKMHFIISLTRLCAEAYVEVTRQTRPGNASSRALRSGDMLSFVVR